MDPTANSPDAPEVVLYAKVWPRVKAILIDGVVVGLAFVAAALVGANIAGTGAVAFVAWVVFWVLYDPLMVSGTGGTIGHHFRNLRVVSDRSGGNPRFGAAFIRNVVKGVLGLWSLFTMAGSAQRKAIHDWVAGTTVQARDADAIRRELERAEQIFAQHGFALEFAPGASREQLAHAARVTGLSFDNALGELYALAGGSFGRTCFAVQTDELTPCGLATLDDALAWWSDWLPRATDDGSRDPRRIVAETYASPNWFPFAEFNSWGTTAYFDLNVGLEGTPEQVIAYQHDPDAFYPVADGLAAFLSRSNALLEQHARDLLFVDGRPSVFSPKRL
jgi:cell wall assembly regulator SMI1/uncharacterized RDD family membrane protein YckC